MHVCMVIPTLVVPVIYILSVTVVFGIAVFAYYNNFDRSPIEGEDHYHPRHMSKKRPGIQDDGKHHSALPDSPHGYRAPSDGYGNRGGGNNGFDW